MKNSLKVLKFVFLFSGLISMAACGSSRKTVYKSPKPASGSSSSSIVSEARSLISRPYRYGGESPSGFDCSGLVQYVYAKQGIQLPRRSSDQANYGKAVPIGSVRQGDLIFFKSGMRVNHVGIVSDTRGKYPSMVHSSSSKGVIEVDLDTSDYWKKRYAFVRRL